jgi:UDP-glucose 4-epimerase
LIVTAGHDRPTAWVTSATSFLGTRISRELNQKGYRVIGFTRRHGLAPAATEGFDQIVSGPFEQILLRGVLDQHGPPSAVFHAIGSGSVGQALADPVADLERTVSTTRILVETLATMNISARLIYPSSAAVYGAHDFGPIAETAAVQPISAYGQGKAAAEQVCRQLAQHTSLQVVILRLFSVYGPPQRKLLLWDLGRRLLAGERDIVLQGTGEETRDFIHVSDAARIVVSLFSCAGPPALLNIGTGRATSVRHLATQLTIALDVTTNVRFGGTPRSGDPIHLQSDTSRLASLGLNSFVPLEQGLVDYARWLRSYRAMVNETVPLSV